MRNALIGEITTSMPPTDSNKNINSEGKKPGELLQHHVKAQEKKVMNSKFADKNLPTRVSTENCTRGELATPILPTDVAN